MFVPLHTLYRVHEARKPQFKNHLSWINNCTFRVYFFFIFSRPLGTGRQSLVIYAVIVTCDTCHTCAFRKPMSVCAFHWNKIHQTMKPFTWVCTQNDNLQDTASCWVQTHNLFTHSLYFVRSFSTNQILSSLSIYINLPDNSVIAIYIVYYIHIYRRGRIRIFQFIVCSIELSCSSVCMLFHPIDFCNMVLGTNSRERKRKEKMSSRRRRFSLKSICEKITPYIERDYHVLSQ